MFLAEHVTGQFRPLTLEVTFLMEASWLPTVLNMLEGIPNFCAIVKNFVRGVFVGWLFKGLSLLYLIL